MSTFHILIPARLASTRLPRKPLQTIAGKALILHVLDRASSCGAQSVHVATDSEEIAELVAAAGGLVVMTSADHRSGTDRLCEAAIKLGLDGEAIVVNLQGDEPAMPAACLRQVAGLLDDNPDARMATLCTSLADQRQWSDPNVVKLVCDQQGRALYFSRASIPWSRSGQWPSVVARRHVGLYAYRADALRQWPQLPISALETLESLEQLRALQAGWRIMVAEAAEPVPIGIDTPEDLERLRIRLEAESES